MNAHTKARYDADPVLRAHVTRQSAEWARRNPEKRNAQKRRRYAARKLEDPEAFRRIGRRHDRRKKYGLTPEDFEAMWTAQGGRCALCREVPTGRVAVDHCHSTGRVRGILCTRCNVGIGNLRDDPDLLQRALDYLRAA